MTKTLTMLLLEAQHQGQDINQIIGEALAKHQGQPRQVERAANDLGISYQLLCHWCDRLGIPCNREVLMTTKTPTMLLLEAQHQRDINQIIGEALAKHQGQPRQVERAASDLDISYQLLCHWCDRFGIPWRRHGSENT